MSRASHDVKTEIFFICLTKALISWVVKNNLGIALVFLFVFNNYCLIID
jgi:hypothetical protein